MNTDGQAEQGNEAHLADAAVARRKLLKAAIGTGVAVGAYSAPKISIVPAYGLTSSNRSDGKCYGLGWSSNAPTAKGWMSQTNQAALFSGNVLGPATGPALDQGQGTATYTWSLGPFDSIPAFTLTIVASGCVNNGTGQWVVSGIPAGYCLKFKNSGDPFDKNTTPTCTGTAGLSGVGVASVASLQSGTVTFTTEGQATCATSGLGKLKWVFDIAPC